MSSGNSPGRSLSASSRCKNLSRAEIRHLDFEASGGIRLVGLDDAWSDFRAPTHAASTADDTCMRWRSGRARQPAFLDRELRSVPIGVLGMAVEQHAASSSMPSRFRSHPECAIRLHLAGGAEDLVQRQHRVVGGVIGVMAGRAVPLLAVGT